MSKVITGALAPFEQSLPPPDRRSFVTHNYAVSNQMFFAQCEAICWLSQAKLKPYSLRGLITDTLVKRYDDLRSIKKSISRSL
jgi:hypothetical protein